MKATTVRLEESMLEKIDGLAEILNRPRSWVIKQAIERFIEYEEWFVQEVNNGVQEVRGGKIATEKEVAEAFNKWGVDAR